MQKQDIDSSNNSLHCAKSLRIWSYSGPEYLWYFWYGVSLLIQFKCRKMRTRRTPNVDTLNAVPVVNIHLQIYPTLGIKLTKTKDKFSLHCIVFFSDIEYFVLARKNFLFKTTRLIPPFSLGKRVHSFPISKSLFQIL